MTPPCMQDNDLYLSISVREARCVPLHGACCEVFSHSFVTLVVHGFMSFVCVQLFHRLALKSCLEQSTYRDAYFKQVAV